MIKRTGNSSVSIEKRIRMRVPACSSPHVCLAVSELAAVTSVKEWINNKVRVIGRLRDFYPTEDVAVLESVAEPEGVFCISVSLYFILSNFRIAVTYSHI